MKAAQYGKIGFDNHRVHCIIGVNANERETTQDIFIDLRIRHDFAKCAEGDSYEDTICYARLAEICTEVAVQGKYRLLETLAAKILNRLENEYHMEWAWIRIKKPRPIPSVEYTVVELTCGH